MKRATRLTNLFDLIVVHEDRKEFEVRLYDGYRFFFRYDVAKGKWCRRMGSWALGIPEREAFEAKWQEAEKAMRELIKLACS